MKYILQPSSLEEEIMLDFFKVMRLTRKQTTMPPVHDEPSSVQLQAMLAILQEKTTMKDIADELHIAFPTATAIIDKLVHAGLVVRENDKDDRRIIRLSLSSEGQANIHSFLKRKMDRVKKVLDLLDKSDKQDLRRIVSNLVIQLEKEPYGK